MFFAHTHRHSGLPRTPGAVAVLVSTLLIASAPAAAQMGDPHAVESLNVIMTQSTRGEVTTCGCRGNKGGLARRATFIETLRDTSDHLVVVDGGDFRLPSEVADTRRDRFMVEELARLGYSAIGVGEEDLRHGVDALRALVEGTGLTLVSANVLDAVTGEPVFRPYTILEVGSIRVGVTSVLGPDLWEEIGSPVAGIRVGAPDEHLAEALYAMRSECDLNVCLIHLAKRQTRELLEGVDGIDIALPSHNPIHRTYGRAYGGARRVCYSHYDGRYICRATVLIRPGGPELGLANAHRLDTHWPEDPDVAARVLALLDAEERSD